MEFGIEGIKFVSKNIEFYVQKVREIMVDCSFSIYSIEQSNPNKNNQFSSMQELCYMHYAKIDVQ